MDIASGMEKHADIAAPFQKEGSLFRRLIADGIVPHGAMSQYRNLHRDSLPRETSRRLVQTRLFRRHAAVTVRPMIKKS